MESPDCNINAAYAEGYAHGSILLLAMRQGRDMTERVRAIHARYLRQVQATGPTVTESAYVEGFRHAVSDNLPCPPQFTPEPPSQRRVA
jgi:hypothetical protein